MYKNPFSFAYNVQQHISTSVALLELVLSKTPELTKLDLRKNYCNDSSIVNGIIFSRILEGNKGTVGKTKELYKKIYVLPLLKQSEVIHKDDYGYRAVERKNTKGHGHKLSPIAECPYKLPPG